LLFFGVYCQWNSLIKCATIIVAQKSVKINDMQMRESLCYLYLIFYSAASITFEVN